MAVLGALQAAQPLSGTHSIADTGSLTLELVFGGLGSILALHVWTVVDLKKIIINKLTRRLPIMQFLGDS